MLGTAPLMAPSSRVRGALRTVARFARTAHEWIDEAEHHLAAGRRPQAASAYISSEAAVGRALGALEVLLALGVRGGAESVLGAQVADAERRLTAVRDYIAGR